MDGDRQQRSATRKRTDEEIALVKGSLESVPQDAANVERRWPAAEQVPGRLPGAETAAAASAAERLELEVRRRKREERVTGRRRWQIKGAI